MGKNRRSQKGYLLYFLSALLIIFLLATYNYFSKANSDKRFYSASEFGVLKKVIDKKIEEGGLEEASNFIKKEHSVGDLAINHAVQHYLGEIIYERIGLEGIEICGNGHLGGCYHGLISKAFYEEGYEEAASKVVKICRDQGDNQDLCVHALGHSFQAEFGANGIEKSLEACKNLVLGSNTPCISGVFMQHYFPSVFRFTFKEVSGDNILGFEESSPYGECLTLENKEFREACFLYTVEWWHFALNGDYTRIIGLCSGLERIEDKENCFKDIGAIFADIVSRETEDIKKVCDMSSLEKEKLLCFSGSLRFLVSNMGADAKETAKLLCGKSENFCILSAKSMFY